MPPPNDGSSELDFGVTLRGLAAKQRLFGRYELREILGRGGMGVVWRAYDEQLERDVALKFLPELLVLDGAAMYELKRETKRSLELTHHHIVRIYDFAQDNRSACISMEYVDGQTLSVSRIGKQNKVFEIDDLGAVIEQACDALEYAHVKAKIVHRDLKPSNLMRNSRGELKVTDFGISRSLSDSVSMLSMRTSGTLVYMSPQQLDGERANPADDIYSLGATVYELLTGKPPFYSGGIERQIRDKVPEAIAARRNDLEIATGKVIPEHWEATIAACLAKDPIQRPRSAADVAKRLGLAVPQYDRTVFLTPPGTASFEKTAEKAAEKTAEAAPPPKRNFAVLAIAILAALAGVLLVWYFGLFLPGETARKAQEIRVAEAEAKKKAAERLAQARGALLVNTEPQGATVVLGAESKKSPSSFNDVSIGPAHLKIFLDGYESVERDVEISENQINDPGVIRLVRIVGSAQVDSIPQSIRFDLIDADGGRQSGTTPATLTNLPTGPAEVIYKPSRGPSHSQRIIVNVRTTVASTWRLPESPSPIPDVSTAMPSVTTPNQVVIAPTTAPPPDREFLGEYTYRGMVGPYEAIFHLKFEAGERVSGYYNLPKSNRNDLILRLEGRNPTGKLYLNEYTNESLSARIDLTLNRSSTEIRWEGTMYNTDKRVFPVSFSRSR